MKSIIEGWQRYLSEELRLVTGGGEETIPSDGYSQDIVIKGYVFPNDDLMDIHVIDPNKGEIGFESYNLYMGPLDFMPLFVEYLSDLGIEVGEHKFKFILDDRDAGESKIYGSGPEAMVEFANDIFAEG